MPLGLSGLAAGSVALAATLPSTRPAAVRLPATTTFGVDVARYQGAIDWTAVAAAGISFATVKASEGPEPETSAATRDYFRVNLPAARAAGLVVGAYHVVRSGDVVSQVDWYLRQIAAVGGDYRQMILQIDYEKFSYDFPPYATLKAFVAELRRHVGAHPIVLYSGKWVFDRIADRPADVAADLGVQLWDSHYGDNPTNSYETIYPGDTSPRWRTWGGWSAPLILQYGSRARVPGVVGNVDVNAFRGTRDQLVSMLTPGAVPVPPVVASPAPTPSPAPSAGPTGSVAPPTGPPATPPILPPDSPPSVMPPSPSGLPSVSGAPEEEPDKGPPLDAPPRGEGPASEASVPATSPGRG